MGLVADRFLSTEKILGVFNIAGGMCLWLISNSTTFAHTYVLMVIYMMIFVPTFSLSNALSFYHIVDPKINFPRIRVWGTIAWVTAGWIIGTLMLESSAIPFRIAAITSFLAGIYAFTLPNTPPTLSKDKSLIQQFRSPAMLSLLKERNFLIVIVSIGIATIPSAYYYTFVNAFLNDIGVVNAAGKMSMGQVTEILIMLVLPAFYRRFSLKHVFFMGLIAWGIRYLLFVVGIHTGLEFWHITALLLHGVAFTFASFTAQIYIDAKVPSTLRATAQGFYSLLTMGVMALLGTYIAGETVSSLVTFDNTPDWSRIWLIPSAVGFFSALFFIIFYRKQDT
jgi:nucleoside transporter